MTAGLSPVRSVSLGVILLAGALLLGVAAGSADLGAGQALLALTRSGAEGGDIIWDFRLPRVLVAALIGGQLALAGALTQSTLRNPLADPGILGITGGASLAAVALILAGERLAIPGRILFDLLPLIACLGGIAAAALVYRLAWAGGAASRRLVLCGIGVSSILQLLVAGLLAGWGQGRIEGMLVWVAGSLYASGWDEVGVLAATAAAGAIALPFLKRPAALLALGDHPARSLGLDVERARLLAIGAAVFLSSTAVAMAGAVGFIGLVVPQAARLLTGPDPERVILVSPLLGAVLAVTADTAGRTLFTPYEVPVGVLCAMIGVPLFLFQLRRSR